ncbi:threonine-phosphate decarboxylase CobD [Egbenema bharatensis]|uniref:threonine-phosphate decarboxylase CobD n=1 Tax=Egbenema bharatensis TaxID=3463334 RepID=UPI003A8ABC08
MARNVSHGGNLSWAASLAGCSPRAILDFSASINPLGPPASAIEAIQSHFPALPHYPDPDYWDLRQTLSDLHPVSADWILPGNGSAELLTWAGRELAERSTTYLLTPGFGDYFRALQSFGAAIVRCPLSLERDGLAVRDQGCEERFHASVFNSDLVSLIQNSDLQTHDLLSTSHSSPLPAFHDAGFLLNNPHNPTGQLFTQEAILPLLEQFSLVVVDEAFMDFLPPDRQSSLDQVIQDYPNLVILRSLTKFYSLPGLRLGYAIAHPDRLKRWQQWRDPWSVNVLAAAAAMAVLQDHAFQQQTWEWLDTARSQLEQGLAALPGLHPLPSTANFLLVQSDHPVVPLQEQLLRQHQILIRNCLSFPELGDRFFRVAVRTEAENQRLLAGLADVLRVE